MSSRIAREELIEELQRLADELDKTPTFGEMNEHGAYSGTPYKSRFGSWNEAVEAAGLEPNVGRRQKYSDDELIEEMVYVASIVDRVPSVSDMNENGRINPSTFIDRFGSWNEAVEAAGLESQRQGTRISDDELIEELQRLADDLGKAPSASEMKEDGAYSEVSYLNRFGSWSNAVEKAGLKTRDERGQIHREHLIDDLRQASDGVDGEYLTMDEYNELGEYNGATLVRRFGSWGEALDAAGLSSEQKRDREPDISNDELIGELQRLADELDKTPTFGEMNEHGAYSGGTYSRRFGSWNEAVEAAGLEPNESIRGRKIAREDLIAELERLQKLIGGIPTLEALEAHGEYSKNAYYSEFGSWSSAVGEVVDK